MDSITPRFDPASEFDFVLGRGRVLGSSYGHSRSGGVIRVMA